MDKGVFEKYNFIVNEQNGDIFPATDFYFYPLQVKDYAEYFRQCDLESYPLMAFVYLTNKCSDDCVGCFAKAIEDGSESLDFDILKKLLIDLSANGTKAVKFAGREPTMYPYLSECLLLCEELGLKTLVITSGSNIDRHRESLMSSCSHLRVSLNTSTYELHEKFHRPSSNALKFPDRVSELKCILAERRARNLVSGATFLIREENNDALEYASLCKHIGFDYVRYTLVDEKKHHLLNGWRNTYHKLLALNSSNFSVTFHEDLPNDYFSTNCSTNGKDCLLDPAIISRVTIHANGKVNSCHEGWRACWPEDNMATYGNINVAGFNEIWLSEKRSKFVQYVIETLKDKSCGTIEQDACNGIKCNERCKYTSFNMIQRWIINQVNINNNAKIVGINIEREWGIS